MQNNENHVQYGKYSIQILITATEKAFLEQTPSSLWVIVKSLLFLLTKIILIFQSTILITRESKENFLLYSKQN